MEINYYDYMSDRKVFYVMDDDKNMKFSAHSHYRDLADYDMICYPDYKQLVLYNIAVLQINEDGKYYYDYDLDHSYDIIDGFTFYAPGLDANISFLIGPNEYSFDQIEEVVMFASIYSHAKVRFTFNTLPENNKKIGIQTRRYLCNADTRHKLARNKVVTRNIIYHKGVCLKR